MTMIMSDFPGQDAQAVTPDNVTNQASPCRKLYVGGTGHVTLVTLAGNVALFSSVPAGTTLDVGFTRVNATGTTATLMTGIV